MNYPMSYNYDKKLNCGKIIINGNTVLFDMDDLFKIINHEKTFTRLDENSQLPYYKRNQQIITYREFLFDYHPSNINFLFKNKDIFDLRRCNIEIYHEYHSYVKENYDVISYMNGHFSRNGKDAYIMKNPIWHINDNEGSRKILMYCEPKTLITLCVNSYNKLIDFERKHNNSKKLTFHRDNNGYISCHYKSSGLFIHQIITGCYGNGKGTKNISVDHIDRDPLNNTYENLRVATRKEQEENSKGIKQGTKRARKTNARQLPEGITHDMLPKYVYYCKECYNKEKQLYREFFRIEKHPNLKTKQIAGTKSSKVSIFEKLEQIKDRLVSLENVNIV
jgi:hypothetical protein